MTHGDLETLIRREIIVDVTTDAYTSLAIFEVTKIAAIEMAAGLDLPRDVATDPVVTMDVGQIIAPDGCLRVHTLFIGGYDAEPADYAGVLRLRLGQSGPVKAFNFDPRRGGVIEIAPLPAATTTATIEYTNTLAVPADNTGAVWGGLLPQWHWLVAYRAAVRLMEMAERTDEAPYWASRYNEGVTALAAMLGRTDLTNLLIEPQQRNDGGSQG